MATRVQESRLSGLVFVDPQGDPSWAHVDVPGTTSSAALPERSVELDVRIAGAGRWWDLEAWLGATHTLALLAIDGDGAVVHEWYADPLGRRTRFLGASMTKSALAHLVGRAVRAGGLTLDDEVCRHVPELRGTGYDGTRVIDVLTMTSGVDWVEDHRDPDSLASRLVACFADGGDSRALLHQVRPGAAPASRFAYCTADSQVLDWVRERATGRSFADDLRSLWSELGCTSSASVGVDGAGVALAGGAVAATVPDWARLARLGVDGTTARGRVLDEAWVDAAARPTYPFLGPGRLPSTVTAHAGFGFHWWPLDEGGRRLAADGSRGQFAAVDRATGAVVVKTSLWPYEDAWADRQCRDLSYLGLHALLDAVGASVPEYHPRKARP